MQAYEKITFEGDDKNRYASKLTPEQVLEIKNHLKDERRIRQVWIAKQFGVSQATIAYYNRQLKNEKDK